MKKIPLQIQEVKFSSYTHTDVGGRVNDEATELEYDNRRYFIQDPEMAGISIRIIFSNPRYEQTPRRGIRHWVNLYIMDKDDMRPWLQVRPHYIVMSKDEPIYAYYFNLPLVGKIDHLNLQFSVFDKTADCWLSSYDFEIFSDESLAARLKEQPKPADDGWEWEYVDDDEESDEDKDSEEEVSAEESKSASFTDHYPVTEPSTPEMLLGLDAVKEKLDTLEKLIIFNKLRFDMGHSTFRIRLHSIFTGAPGTGKTTVARMLGEMLFSKGLLSSGHVVVRDRATLIGRFYDYESANTYDAIAEATGGILLIKDAHLLLGGDYERDPGRGVIHALISALSNPDRRDWMLILSGRPEGIRKLLEAYPALRLHIPEANVWQFADFTVAELLEMARRYLRAHNYLLTPAAYESLEARIEEDYASGTASLGNARYVINLVESEIIPAICRRFYACGDLDNFPLTEVEASDIPTAPD